jgi:hypothetical protein
VVLACLMLMIRGCARERSSDRCDCHDSAMQPARENGADVS